MRWLPALLLTVFLQTSISAQKAPARMEFCGMDLTLDAGAREYIDGVIAQLTKSPTYFEKLVEIAEMHLPHVERAFAEEGVPDDMKYIGMQESAFRGNAVSSSGAVGYWQFKEPAAKVAGLTVNGEVDERKHLYLSSRGAARYFTFCNKEFDNWVYAIIGYNRGPVGALSFVEKQNYGARKMAVTKKTHWYALKAIAHKILFDHALAGRTPQKRLDAIPARTGSGLSDWARETGLDKDVLEKYNYWLKAGKVPEGKEYVYFVPREGAPALAGRKPVVKDPITVRDAVPEEPSRDLVRGKFIERDIFRDEGFGTDYLVLREGEILAERAAHHGVKLKKILRWNGNPAPSSLDPGDIIYLSKLKKAPFHIVQPGETLSGIAELHHTSIDKILKANRLSSAGQKLLAGQKLYIKEKRPRGEKTILLVHPRGKVGRETKTNVVESPRTPPVRAEQKDSPPQKAKSKTHTVREGETLWRISQNHGVSVDELKKWNRLRSNEIFVGQILVVEKPR